MAKKRKRSRYVADADKWFSLYIRQRDAGECFVCGIVKDTKEMHNGHLITRGCYSVRWDEKNAFCSCPGCNYVHENRPEIMTNIYIERFGLEAWQELVTKSKQVVKISNAELEEIANHYKELVK